MAFYHTTCLFASKNKQRAEIYSAALKSWENVRVRKNHIHESAFSRNSETELGDTERKLVFIKDVINYRFSTLKKNDYVILSNLDIFVCADFIERAKELLKHTDAFFAQRKDIAFSQAFDIIGGRKVLIWEKCLLATENIVLGKSAFWHQKIVSFGKYSFCLQKTFISEVCLLPPEKTFYLGHVPFGPRKSFIWEICLLAPENFLFGKYAFWQQNYFLFGKGIFPK